MPVDSAKTMLDQVEFGLIRYDRSGQILFHNRQVLRLLGLSEAEFLARCRLRQLNFAGLGFVADDESPFADIDWPALRTLESGGLPDDVVIGVPFGPREFRWILASSYPLKEASSLGVTVTLHDVTESRGSMRQQRLAAEVFRASTQAIMITDAQWRIVAVNPAFERLTSFAEREALGQNGQRLGGREFPDAVIEAIRIGVAQTGFWEGEISNTDKEGRVFRESLTVLAVRNTQGAIDNHIATFTDVTDRKEAEERIQFLANYDPLTEMPNRGMLNRLLDFALVDAERQDHTVAVMFIDLDNFKWVNDSLGHHMGDRLLLEVARRIKETVRASDIVARQGGDEFIVALRNLGDGREAGAVADKLVEVLSRPIVIDDHRLTVGASVGIAVYPRDGTSREDLLRNADAAMYEAKRSGRSQYVFYSPVLNTQAMSFAVTATRLRNALATGGFDLFYQPLVSSRDRCTIGFEALIRAKDGVLGDPGLFIPVAERTGLISEIGEWVVVEACSQLRRWIDAGHNPPTIAINVSPNQLRDQALIRTLSEAIAFARIPAHLIEIELTETTLMERLDEAREALIWLRNRGIKVAIDDFGTGYSSLAYLERLPIDRLKIDRSFVSEVGQEGRGKVASAIISLAKSLDLEVVAEGVETELQARWLTDMGCEYLQGYYFSRPIPARDIRELLG